MNGYSLVIDISSDKENVRRSTPTKTLPVNMVGKSNPSYSSTEVFRGSDTEFDSILRISPIKKMKKIKRVTFNFPNLPTAKKSDSEQDYYEEPDSPPSLSPVWPSRDSDTPVTNSLNGLNELPTRLETAEDYKNAWCTPEAEEYFAKLTLELEIEERDVYMYVGRGRGPDQIRNYLSRPPKHIEKEIPHCHGLPAFLATRGEPVTTRSQSLLRLVLRDRKETRLRILQVSLNLIKT